MFIGLERLLERFSKHLCPEMRASGGVLMVRRFMKSVPSSSQVCGDGVLPQ